MKKIGLGLICLTAGLNANEALVAYTKKDSKPTKVSYDTDLFRKDKKVVFVNAEFLYWIVNEGALDYALKMKQPAWGSPTDGVGHYKIEDFDWSPGFRVNFGYFNAPHYWDAFLQYTYFRGKGDDKAKAPNTPELFLNGTWPQPHFDLVDEVPLSTARSSIEMRLDLLEFLCTRRFHPNPHLRMRLFGGATVAWLRQNWEIDYVDTTNHTSHIHNHWRFTGAGIRAGCMVDWFLGKGGFFFTGLVSGAVYAGGYHNISKQRSSDSNDQFNTALPLRNTHYSDTRLIPHFQALAGPSWQKAFKSCRTEIFAGYELNFWSNLHEVFRTGSTVPTQAKQTYINNSIIGIQGLTVRWNLDF